MDGKAYFESGLANHSCGKFEQAISDFTEAIRLKPTSAGAHCCRAASFAMCGKSVEAISDYNTALKLGADNREEVYCGLGVLYASTGNHKEAVNVFSKAIEENPKNSDAYTGRGRELLWIEFEAKGKEGNYDAAIRDLNKAISLNPNDAEAYCGLGLAYWERSEIAKSEENYKKCLKIDPCNSLAQRGIVQTARNS